MPKVKVKRKSTIVDMTAMCDVSFLLLTFFILTAKFKPAELVAVDVPFSRSSKHIGDNITIIVNKEGKSFITSDVSLTRLNMLNQMVEKYGDKYPNIKSLTDNQKQFFSKIETWGTPMSDLPRVLSMDGLQLQAYQKQMPGIPTDSLNDQLADWVQSARYATDGNIQIAIKADKDTNIEPVKAVIKGLTSKDIHQFLLITTLGGPATTGAEPTKTEGK